MSLDRALTALAEAHARARARWPGDRPVPQPLHVLYGGAHLFRADSAARMGALALQALERWAPDAEALAEAFALPPALAARVHPRVRARLAAGPVQDQRLDFEDGYGFRPDDEEDAHAVAAATEVARGLVAGSLAPRLGIRVKALTPESTPRALRTLGRFLRALAAATGGRLPPGFVVTLPKVTLTEQVATLAAALGTLEDELGLPRVGMELMIEAPQALIDADGRCPIGDWLRAGEGRVEACHIGTYDLTAALGVTAACQHLHHPAAAWARRVLQAALAGTGVWVVDGATTVLPVPPHRGEGLSPAQAAENRAAVHRAWRRAAADIRGSLAEGFYAGWDLHPAQLVSRYVAVQAFFLEALDPAAERLRHFLAHAARATRVGDAFDDAATGQGLLNFFARAVDCGAIGPEEVAATGLTLEEVRARSFLRVVEARRA